MDGKGEARRLFTVHWFQAPLYCLTLHAPLFSCIRRFRFNLTVTSSNKTNLYRRVIFTQGMCRNKETCD